MEVNEILRIIFQIVIIPLLTVLTGYAVKWINAQANKIKSKTENELAQKYIDMLNDTITTAVISVNQTYVNSLKEQGTFDKQAQMKAFEDVFDIVMAQLTEEANKYLNEIYGDLNVYIANKIEEQVNLNKTITAQQQSKGKVY